ncbi:hypothetical protein [Acidovorax sp. 69]|uniref:hypothetical protein n=1 Tax=Acidovorax sp. 69 TaxID=2035202 RepID=UPI0018E1EB7D|nr:hypothetical protein [Acidovorax sp. 69]
MHTINTEICPPDGNLLASSSCIGAVFIHVLPVGWRPHNPGLGWMNFGAFARFSTAWPEGILEACYIENKFAAAGFI